MPYQVVNLGTLTPTSSGATVSNGIGGLDDAASITIWISSSAGGSSTAGVLQVAQFDPWLGTSAVIPGIAQSTVYQPYVYPNSSVAPNFGTSGQTITLSNISFRGLRLATLTSFTSGEIIGWVSKQITVIFAGLSVLGPAISHLLSVSGPFAI